MAWAARKFSLVREIPLPRSQVWELLSHTDRLNQAIGLPVVNFDPVATGDATLARVANARLAGLAVRWKEYPFHWVREQSYSVSRVYESGSIHRLDGGLELADATATLPDGSPATQLHLFAEAVPANAFGAVLVPFIARQSLQRTLQYCEQYLAQCREGHCEPPAVPSTSQVNEAHLARLLRALEQQPVKVECARRLERFLRERGDNEVAALRPYELAAQWDAEPDDVLRLCLHATRAGLLNLSWNLMCPNCRVSKATVSSLSQLTEQFHCDLCGVSYSANFDRYVELRFAVHPGVREAVANTYCIGGPFVAPHVLVQRPIPGGGETLIKYPETTEPLRLRVLRSNNIAEIILADDSAQDGVEVETSYTSDGWVPDTIVLPSRGASLRIANKDTRDVIVVLEQVEWDPRAVTAARVTAMQEFHDLFSSEVLAPGQHVGIENLTLFFSDLRDSTAMYETLKDAPAYNRVRRHFDFLFDHIASNRGSVVKTIGDAVMAAFYTPEDAVKASLDIQSNVADFNATLPAGEAISIKIGLHNGPAIAINSNDRLDYFGRTVNIAARVSARSKGDDIVLSECCYEREGVQEFLYARNVTIDMFQCDLKGIDGVFDLYRVRLQPGS